MTGSGISNAVCARSANVVIVLSYTE